MADVSMAAIYRESVVRELLETMITNLDRCEAHGGEGHDNEVQQLLGDMISCIEHEMLAVPFVRAGKKRKQHEQHSVVSLQEVGFGIRAPKKAKKAAKKKPKNVARELCSCRKRCGEAIPKIRLFRLNRKFNESTTKATRGDVLCSSIAH